MRAVKILLGSISVFYSIVSTVTKVTEIGCAACLVHLLVASCMRIANTRQNTTKISDGDNYS